MPIVPQDKSLPPFFFPRFSAPASRLKTLVRRLRLILLSFVGASAFGRARLFFVQTLYLCRSQNGMYRFSFGSLKVTN